MLKSVVYGAVIAAFLAQPAAADFKIAFTWAGLKSCTNGRPNTVYNPEFKVSGLPKGTTAIQFKLQDLDVPGYVHGGGWVKMSADGTVPAKSFKYKSPCPPSGVHTYEWTAIAKTKRRGGDIRGMAKAKRKYPE